MPVQPYDYLDLGGGLNQGAAPSAIDPREMQELQNWYPYASRLRRRGGVRRLTTTSAWDTDITAMFPLKKSDGTWVLLVGGGAKFGKLDGTSVVDLPFGGSLGAPAPSTAPWVFFQYKNHAYALRKGYGTLLRLSDDVVLEAGMAAPAAACTIAQGAAGDLSAADYRAVYTDYNTDTGMESNPSPVSNVLSLGASKKIDYTGIAISANPFTNARRVYRALPNQQNEYFFVFQISNNVDTTFTGENVKVVDLGRTVSFRNGVPPAGLDVATIWNERLFASDGTDLFFSELLLAEAFSDDFISIEPDDGHVIRGLLGHGDRLIIGKTNKMHFLVGTDRSSFSVHVLTEAHGCKSHHSLKGAEGLFFWFGTGKAVFRSDGTVVHDISTPKVKPILDAIPDAQEEQVVGAMFPALNWYVLAVPDVSAGNNMKVLVYNYKFGTWTVFTHPGGGNEDSAPQFLGDFFDTNFGHILYATFYDGHIYHYNDPTYGSDWGTAIPAQFRIKKDNFGYPGYRKFFKEVWLLIPDVVGGQVQLEVFRDNMAAAVIDRTASLDFGESAWKAYKLQHATKPGSTLDMRVTYSGSQAIDIDQIHFAVGLLARRPMRAR